MKVQLGHNRETEQDNTDPAGRPTKFRTWDGEGGANLVIHNTMVVIKSSTMKCSFIVFIKYRGNNYIAGCTFHIKCVLFRTFNPLT